MARHLRRIGALALAASGFLTSQAPPAAQSVRPARTSEDVQTIKTHAFFEPNPVPILTKDARLHPYHSFEGYEHEGTPRPWKVVCVREAAPL